MFGLDMTGVGIGFGLAVAIYIAGRWAMKKYRQSIINIVKGG